MDILNSPQKSSMTLIKDLLEVAIPFTITVATSVVIELINLHFLGKKGDAYIVAGIGLGTVYFNTLGLTVLTGMNSTVSTLVA